MGPWKKKITTISMEIKLQAIKRVDRGESITTIAREMGLRYETVRKWKKNRKNIEEWCVKMKTRESRIRSRMRMGENKFLDEAVFVWFILQRRQGIYTNGPIIQSKALNFCELTGGAEHFLASSGWLRRWKRRYGIRLFKTCAEEMSTDSSAVESFSGSLFNIIEDEQLTCDQVFTCDQTELYYKTMPPKTVFGKSDSEASGFKKHKDHVTLLACSNASGSLKLPVMVIGKSEKPKSLQHLNTDNFPVFYRYERRGWMDSELFKEWFNLEFIPRVSRFLEGRKLPLKALLLIDNDPTHPPEKDLKQGAMRAMFFPLNVTSHAQPMNQGVWENLKRHYWIKVMSSIIDVQESGGEIIDILKSISMKDLIFWIAESWGKVTHSTIRKSWRTICPECTKNNEKRSKNENEDVSNARLFQIIQQIDGCEDVKEEDLKQWINKGNEAMDILSDQEIISMVMECTQEEDDEEENKLSLDGKVVTLDEERDSCLVEDCQDMDKEDFQQSIKEECDYEDPLSDQAVISMAMESERKGEMEKRCSANSKTFVLEGGSHRFQSCDNMDMRKHHETIKKECEATNTFSNRETNFTEMADEHIEENDEKEHRCPSNDNVYTPAEAKDAAERLITFLEKLTDYPMEDLMALRRARDKAAWLTVQKR